jgi:uncharacterized OB-fold protein
MSEEQPKLKKVKCPHCGKVLTQGEDLCCEALRTELNILASNNGASMDRLTAAFNKWFADHEVKD